MSALETTFVAPRRGVAKLPRAVLLAHGAGSDMHAPALVAVSDALRDAGIASLRFHFPYRGAGRRAPDRMPVLMEALCTAHALLVRRTSCDPAQVVVGGRSMGGRVASCCVADPDDPLAALGLVLLAYPLHPPGKPEQLRVEHLSRITVPVLSISGTRDAFASKTELTRALRRVRGPVTRHWLETADHGYKPLRSSGATLETVLADVAQAVTAWVCALT
ncbi:MAG: alpha/beta family hydrolase [Acidimicrobiia bacterium]